MKFLIWTTTPWTIPANLGISVHPEFTYVIVNAGEEKYIIAKDLLAFVAEEIGWEDYSIERELIGSELDRVVAQHPLYDRIHLSCLVSTLQRKREQVVYIRHRDTGKTTSTFPKLMALDALCPVDDRGVMTDEAPGFEGLFYEDANKAVTEALEKVGALVKLKFVTHSYPHDWRTKKPVIFRATAQWFASIESFRTELLGAIKETKFTPSWGETRLYNMVRDRGDWCISRQRVWGVPIPVFYGENGEANHYG